MNINYQQNLKYYSLNTELEYTIHLLNQHGYECTKVNMQKNQWHRLGPNKLCVMGVPRHIKYYFFFLVGSFEMHFVTLTGSSTLDQCSSNVFAHEPLLAMKNNHGSSHPCSSKCVFRQYVSKIKILYTDLN